MKKLLLISAFWGFSFTAQANEPYKAPTMLQDVFFKSGKCGFSASFNTNQITKFEKQITVPEALRKTTFILVFKNLVCSQENFSWDDDPLMTLKDKKEEKVIDGLQSYTHINSHIGKVTIYVLPQPFDGRIRCTEKPITFGGEGCQLKFKNSNSIYSFPIYTLTLRDWPKYLAATEKLVAASKQ